MWFGKTRGDEARDKAKNEDVGEIDGVGPVANGGEEGQIANELGALEFEGSEEEEGGEGAVESRRGDCQGWLTIETKS